MVNTATTIVTFLMVFLIQKIRKDLEAECNEEDRPHTMAAVDRLLRRF